MFVNGEKIDGALPIEEVRAVLDRALQRAWSGGAGTPAGRAAYARQLTYIRFQ